MKLGARNAITGRVTTVQSDKIMSLIKFDVDGPIEMASVITTESLEAMNLKPGDTVELVVKAIHVLPIKP
jgi:molybdate transport system regulatory protein